MILSHTKKFILFKTIKTASTSTGVFFEPYCRPDDQVYIDYDRYGPPLISDSGIITTRSEYMAHKYGWYIHTPAIKLKYFLRDYWNEYFKFTNVRNTFDVIVSFWWFSWAIYQKQIDFKNMSFDSIAKLFQKSICEHDFGATFLPNSRYYSINNQIEVDFFIRQEHFVNDVKEVCQRLDIPFTLNNEFRFKDDVRLNSTHFSRYYNTEAADVVYKRFKFEIDHFGYSV